MGTEQSARSPARNALADWLRPWPWDWWMTLTFSAHIQPERASFLLKCYLRELEETHGDQVSCLIGREQKTWSGCGSPAGRVHFHLLLASPFHLTEAALKDLWSLPKYGGTRTSGASAAVWPYNPGGGAIDYLIESSKDPAWDHDEWKLELLSPVTARGAHGTSRSRRKDRRRQERLAACTECLPVLAGHPLRIPRREATPKTRDGSEARSHQAKETRKLGCRG